MSSKSISTDVVVASSTMVVASPTADQTLVTSTPTATVPTATLVQTETPNTPTTPAPSSTPTPETPVFEVITAGNFGSLELVSQNNVDFDIEFGQFYELVFKPDTVWYIHPAPEGNQVTDLLTQKDIISLEEQGDSGFLIISSDNSLMATVNPDVHEINLWDMKSLQKIRTFVYPASSYRELQGAFSRDNAYLAVAGCHVKGNPYCLSSGVYVYNVITGETILELIGYHDAVGGLAFSLDKQLLFISGDGEKIRNADLLVWDLEKNERHFEFSLGENDLFINLALDDNGSVLASVSRNGNVHIWDVSTWKKVGEIPANISRNITFLPETDLFLATEVRDTLKLGRGNSILKTKKVGSGRIGKLWISPDGRFLFIVFHTGRTSGSLQKWGVVQ
ncbi:WD40 repeat domain-containing protein [Chloroflexota bacterium]